MTRSRWAVVLSAASMDTSCHTLPTTIAKRSFYCTKPILGVELLSQSCIHIIHARISLQDDIYTCMLKYLHSKTPVWVLLEFVRVTTGIVIVVVIIVLILYILMLIISFLYRQRTSSSRNFDPWAKGGKMFDLFAINEQGLWVYYYCCCCCNLILLKQ